MPQFTQYLPLDCELLEGLCLSRCHPQRPAPRLAHKLCSVDVRVNCKIRLITLGSSTIQHSCEHRSDSSIKCLLQLEIKTVYKKI